MIPVSKIYLRSEQSLNGSASRSRAGQLSLSLSPHGSLEHHEELCLCYFDLQMRH